MDKDNDKTKPVAIDGDITTKSNDLVNVEKDELEEKGYYKLPKEYVSYLDLLVQKVPDHIAQKMTVDAANKTIKEVTHDAYRVVLKDGMHLGKSHNTPGALKGMAFSKDNDLKAMPDLFKITSDGVKTPLAPQLIQGAFNIMSLATGQYFLSEINSTLSTLEDGVSNIQGFLETDKRSEIEADEETLVHIYYNLRYIMDNDMERMSVSANLKNMKNKALKEIKFFRAQTEKERNKIRKDSKYDTVKEAYRKLMTLYPQYWCAVRNYNNSTFLDTVITEMDDPDYLLLIYVDVRNQIMLYEESFSKSEYKLNNFIKESKELNKKKILPDGAESIVKAIPASNGWLAFIKAAAAGGMLYDNYRQDSSKQKRNKTLERAKQFSEACSNVTPLNETVRLIEEYRKSRNNPVEVLVVDNEAYVKYLDDYESAMLEVDEPEDNDIAKE